MSIKELRVVLNEAGSQIDEAVRLLDLMTVSKNSEIFDKHLDGIRNTLNKMYIEIGILNVKTLRAEFIEKKEVNNDSNE